MAVKLFFVGVLSLSLLCLGGCATGRKQTEVQSLKSQVQLLESQLQEKDQELMGLRDALDRQKYEAQSSTTEEKPVVEVKSRPTMKQIQTALKNAGYDPGPVDGRKGKQTREAIKAFQKANNLSVDGKVGKQTWALLSEYLEKKEK